MRICIFISGLRGLISISIPLAVSWKFKGKGVRGRSTLTLEFQTHGDLCLGLKACGMGFSDLDL